MQKEFSSTNIIMAVVIFVTGFVFGAAWEKNALALSNRQDDMAAERRIETITKNDFTLTAKYQDKDEWDYTVTGVLPNRCIKYDVTETVAESLPELVTISIVVFEPEDNSLCAQAIQTVEESGSFVASEEAEVVFNFTRENGRPTATGLENRDEN